MGRKNFYFNFLNLDIFFSRIWRIWKQTILEHSSTSAYPMHFLHIIPYAIWFILNFLKSQLSAYNSFSIFSEYLRIKRNQYLRIRIFYFPTPGKAWITNTLTRSNFVSALPTLVLTQIIPICGTDMPAARIPKGHRLARYLPFCLLGYRVLSPKYHRICNS